MGRSAARFCVVCGKRIPDQRLRLLPTTATCVRHSDALPKTERDVDLDGADPEDLKHSAMAPHSER